MPSPLLAPDPPAVLRPSPPAAPRRREPFPRRDLRLHRVLAFALGFSLPLLTLKTGYYGTPTDLASRISPADFLCLLSFAILCARGSPSAVPAPAVPAPLYRPGCTGPAVPARLYRPGCTGPAVPAPLYRPRCTGPRYVGHRWKLTQERDGVGPRCPWYRDPYTLDPYGCSAGLDSANRQS